ncbi:MAG: glycosyltransferase family 4 protein [Pseudomonadota bacterium]
MTKPALHICIVTSEVVGPFKNGGIGTSMTGLAQSLADQGFRVTLLFTAGKGFSPQSKAIWSQQYQSIGIELLWIDHRLASAIAGPLAACDFAVPYLVYQALGSIGADIVQFNDCMGEGLYYLAMHRLGCGIANQRCVVALHSPTEWIWAINRNLPEFLVQAAFSHAERLSVATCDQLWSPSRYLLDWVRDRGFAVQSHAVVQQYALPKLPMFAGEWAVEIADKGGAPQPAREIVFFGRIEERKGIKLFCEALTMIEPTLVELGVYVTFLGKESTVGGQRAFDYLDQQSSHWRFTSRRLSDLGQQEAINYIQSHSALAVMASPADNSPCTVYEALAHDLPFIAARTGGIPELIAAADHAHILFDYSADALAERLRVAVTVGIAPARAAQLQSLSRAAWGELFPHWHTQRFPEPPYEAERPLALLVDHWPGSDIAATLASCEVADTARVIIIDRTGHEGWGTLAPHAIIVRDFAGLHAALSGLTGHLLLCIRSGVTLIEPSLPALRCAMQSSEVDMLMPFALVGEGAAERCVTTLGASASFCYFAGAMHAGVLVVKGDAALRAIAGRDLVSEMEFFGLPDLLVTAELNCLPYAEPVAHHGPVLIPEHGHRRTRERVAAYAAVDGVERFYLTALASSRAAGIVGSDRLRRMRQWLDAHGAGWLGTLARRGRLHAVLIALFGRRQV